MTTQQFGRKLVLAKFQYPELDKADHHCTLVLYKKIISILQQKRLHGRNKSYTTCWTAPA
jgi:hypothetical protein